MVRALQHLGIGEEGQDLVEYVLIAGLISTVIWVIIQQFGTAVGNLWNPVQAKMNDAVSRM